jgi:hypothetical protein
MGRQGTTTPHNMEKGFGSKREDSFPQSDETHPIIIAKSLKPVENI